MRKTDLKGKMESGKLEENWKWKIIFGKSLES